MLKLIILDMDGTLFDTTYVNYYSYKSVVEEYGYSLDYEFYKNECNGRHYKDFLPLIVSESPEVLETIHEKKKLAYPSFLDKAKLNESLLGVVRTANKAGVSIALVTTANKRNVEDILNCFDVKKDFELILTSDDITLQKPDPQGFLLAMEHFGVKPEETLIFEDSPTGLEAAKNSGADYCQVYNYR